MGNYFWLVAYQYTPNLCQPIGGNVAINERPAALLARTLEHIVGEGREDDVLITFAHEISREEYQSLRPYNPGAGAYIQLLESDRGDERVNADD